ncbi:class I adenylate-forming enzyme family protein [Hydrogenophaga sp. 2FB]|uniref:class I adenylate-forming enzyme family protein n=1 Tax=Hydrogenophaga sp. 2FB TaxID=2502187 RepID=UPI0010F9EC57|nr:class I adenylate-forming enzyme family protein [Hydrogenophaga sp. 2FB]
MNPVVEAPLWGREVEAGRVQGHACRIYTHRPRSVGALLRDARRWQGGRTFVVEGERRLSFGAFEAAVARVVVQLQARGVRTGDRVVLLAYNSIEWLAAFWAVQSLGAVAVLCNAWWSAQETSEAIADVEPSWVLADWLAKRGLRQEPNVIDMATVRQWVDGGERHALPPPPDVSEDALAIIMFTSGTTGRAKGALMSQGGVVANLQNLLVLTGRLPSEMAPDAPGTVSLLTVPLFHLAGVQVSISTLLTGGKLVLLEGRFDAAAVLRLIEQERVRVWGSIPTMVSRVLEHPDIGRHDVSSLRSIPMGGSAISPELRARIPQVFPGVKKSVGSLYGCTEAGGILAAGSADDLRERPGCVGKPLPVVELRIVNADAQGVGDIQARTPTVTLGVWGEAEAATDSEGWVRTGDLGRYENGYLFLSGRSKDIVIRAGENIACAHVEQCLQTHPAVQEVAVLPLPHADLGEEVAAVVVLREGQAVTSEALAAHAQSHLGKFQVPSRWWLRREPLPTNATGKIAKAELKANWLGD